MLEFEEKCILTGMEQRTTKDGSKTYVIINFLGESGQTFGCMYEGEGLPGAEFKQLDKVNVTFKVFPGRYTQLKVLKLKKAL